MHMVGCRLKLRVGIGLGYSVGLGLEPMVGFGYVTALSEVWVRI